mmetsp:Transcript_55364/g.115809  ORF Transcript_55364/g.115809 Transcript_55364/m.115809 type:complete len:97 (-) Transcript_55364:536-826(-)
MSSGFGQLPLLMRKNFPQPTNSEEWHGHVEQKEHHQPRRHEKNRSMPIEGDLRQNDALHQLRDPKALRADRCHSVSLGPSSYHLLRNHPQMDRNYR